MWILVYIIGVVITYQILSRVGDSPYLEPTAELKRTTDMGKIAMIVVWPIFLPIIVSIWIQIWVEDWSRRHRYDK